VDADLGAGGAVVLVHAGGRAEPGHEHVPVRRQVRLLGEVEGGGGVLEDADDVPAVVVLVDVVGVDGGDEDVAGADEDVEGAVHAAGAVGDEVAEVVPALVEAGHGVLVRTAGDGRPQLRPVGAVVDGDSVVEDGG